MANPITVSVLIALWGIFFYSLSIAMNKLLSNDIIVTMDHEDVHSFEFPAITVCSEDTRLSNISSYKQLFDEQNSIRITNASQYFENVMNETLLESLNLTVNGILFSSIVQNPWHKTLSVCFSLKPPKEGKIGMHNMVTLGIAIPESQLGKILVALACYKEEMFQNFNALFGCDFITTLMPTSHSIETMTEIGIEIERIKKRNMDMPRKPCQTEEEDKVIPDIFDCYVSQIHQFLGCRVTNKTSLLNTSPEFCSSEEQYNKTAAFMETYVHALEMDVIRKTGCIPLCNTEHYSLIKRWEMTTSRNMSTWHDFSLDTAMTLSFMVQNSKVTVETQQKLYMLSNFIADIGGYLGLLLGASCFTAYQVVFAFLEKKFFKKMRG